MILSDTTIKKYIQEEKIIIAPQVETNDIRPVGIRLHLSNKILIPKETSVIDFDNPPHLDYQEIDLSKEEFILKPNQFVLGSTRETIFLPSKKIVAYLDGRSTIARLGMTIHISCAWADGNHEEARSIVLEIKNNGPYHIKLKSKLPVATLIFHELSEPISQSAQTQYKNQSETVGANLSFKR